MARLLLIKATRRMRREGWFASTLWLGLSIDGGHWGRAPPLRMVGDDIG